ncbi:SusD family protein [bacterium A37T11]|nr:SusD family protein [bacterium A37T11]
MKKTLHPITVCSFLLLLTLQGCNFLDKKPDQKLELPDQIQDLQALLDDDKFINQSDPATLEICADSYYLQDADYMGLTAYDQQKYIWGTSSVFEPGTNNIWATLYRMVYTSNVVLYELNRLKRTLGDETAWDICRGSALFIRAKTFQQLAWIWAAAYDESNATNTPAIPLRLDISLEEPLIRSSLQRTYDQIIHDFTEAITLLPIYPTHVIQPSQAAAYGWLSRTYLSMGRYAQALSNANQCLALHSALLDYNSINPNAQTPFSSYRPEEIIYHSTLKAKSVIALKSKVDSVLYQSYLPNDLRKKCLFYQTGANQYRFKGSYAGTTAYYLPFNGIATDELYLVRAECLARINDVPGALSSLNELLQNRYAHDGSFIGHVAATSEEALVLILTERKKELYFRGVRWMDIKRLNQAGAGIGLTRVLQGHSYSLPANDTRFVLPIPEDVTLATGLEAENPE